MTETHLSLPLIGSAHVADALVTLGLPIRALHLPIVPLLPEGRAVGPALPVRHSGSVDIFLEVLDRACGGNVLVVDNDGRLDEGCIGDLVALEARMAGIAGVVIHGCHRDTTQCRQIGLPIWSLGACSAGPIRHEQARSEITSEIIVSGHRVEIGDWVVADSDGVIFVAASNFERVTATAQGILEREQRQVAAIEAGSTLRAELQFARYLEERRLSPSLTLREHLRKIHGAVEA